MDNNLTICRQHYYKVLPDVQAGFRKGRGTRDQIIKERSYEKQENSRKKSTSASLTTPKPLIVWITVNCGKFLKRWEYQTTLPASWEICMQVKKQQLEPDIEQQTASKLGKEYIKAVYCHSAYLTYMQSEECESESHSVMSDSLWPHGLYSPWNSPGQNTGVGSISLLQGIFLTQG